MIDRVEELLQRGSAVLAPLLLKHGFLFKAFALGGSSGGSYASGEFTRSTRRLEYYYRSGACSSQRTHLQYCRIARQVVQRSRLARDTSLQSLVRGNFSPGSTLTIFYSLKARVTSAPKQLRAESPICCAGQTR
jgi:hypothetical protein